MPPVSGWSSNHLLTKTTTSATTDLKGQNGISSTLSWLRDRRVRTFPFSQTELTIMGRHMGRAEDSLCYHQDDSDNLKKKRSFLDLLLTRKISIKIMQWQQTKREKIIQIHLLDQLVQEEVVMHHWETSSEILIKMITSGKRSNDIKTFAHKISILKVKLSAPGWRMQFSRKESGPVWTRAQIFSSQFPPGHLRVTQWNIMMVVTILMRLVTTMAMRVLHHLLSDRLPDRDREEWRLLV